MQTRSLLVFQQRSKESALDSRSSAGGKARFGSGGVGGDGDCALQMVVDEWAFGGAVLSEPSFLADLPYDTVKVRLSQHATVTGAVESCRKARKLKCAVAVATPGSEDAAASDPFVADFAVGVSAGQFHGGGLASSAFCEPYNRLLEIAHRDSGPAYAGLNFRNAKR